MKRRLAGLIGVGASIVAGIVLLTSGPALADTVTKPGPQTSDLNIETCITEYGSCFYVLSGAAGFKHAGDHLYVWDDDADGYSVVAQYTRSDTGGIHGQLGEAWNHYGYGSRIDHNMDIPESGWIQYRACLGDYSGGRKVFSWSCTGWLRESAA